MRNVQRMRRKNGDIGIFSDAQRADAILQPCDFGRIACDAGHGGLRINSCAGAECGSSKEMLLWVFGVIGADRG